MTHGRGPCSPGDHRTRGAYDPVKASGWPRGGGGVIAGIGSNEYSRLIFCTCKLEIA